MKALEEGLRRVPFSEPVLLIKQMNASCFWDKVCWRYKGLRGLTPHEKAKVEFIASGKLQTRYEELNARVEKAIEDYNLDEADASAVSSASGDSIPRKKPRKKNLLREAIKSAMKPSDTEEGKKLCEKPPVDKGQGDLAVLSEVNDDDYIDDEDCYGDIYCSCGCRDDDDDI